MNKVVLFSTCVFLAACGGGGDSDVSNVVEEVPDLEITVDYSPITGVYKADIETNSGLTDVNYLSIDSDGYLTAYNYQGDEVGTGEDCYTVATGTDVNSFYTGQKLTFDVNSMQYSVSANTDRGFDLAWEIDDSGNLIQLFMDSTISSNYAIQSSSDAGNKISFSVIKSYENNAEIKSKLCS
ncbi:hypothetical protein [Motilimonas sp. E26]|uniref:hypothetical protein n=1 Tax=Motilimonas sp. E26 TaxID=2865674 RepID=UPI001E5E0CEF|nr:hypothetical protein [Motilimonas sp. E26]MCE0559182.1 hypothetical protein [Motilimonas sp. E26]